MSTFAENDPIIVDRSEGHELIDVDGRRYLDAISSLWVNTLGHCVPELDDAIRRQLELGAHSTMLGNGNRVVIELSEALARVVPVDDPHFLYASDGASAVEQALKIAFQHWANLGAPAPARSSRSAARTTATRSARSRSATTASAPTSSTPLRFPVLRAPAFDDPACFDVACDMVARARDGDRGGDHRAARAGRGGHAARRSRRASPASAPRAPRTTCCSICDEVATGFGRTGTLFASEQADLRPDLLCLGKAMTAGYLAMSVTVASDRVFRSFLGDDLGERTLYHGHSYGGNALAAAVALRHLELFDAWNVLANVRERSDELRRSPARPRRVEAGRARSAPRRA